MPKKPEGLAAATDLLRKVVQVPKAELDRHLAEKRKKRAKQPKK